jgi:hypothetical protein
MSLISPMRGGRGLPTRRATERHTSRISSSVIEPATSLLFLKTSSEAPMRRWEICQKMYTHIFGATYLLHEQAFEFLPAVCETFAVCGIDNPDECICLFEVVLPIGSECLLTADVP